MSLATPEKIRTLQRKLYRKAKAEPAYRFYLLCDKIYREDILRHAYALARSNAGAPGTDGMTFAAIEAILNFDLVANYVHYTSRMPGNSPDLPWLHLRHVTLQRLRMKTSQTCYVERAITKGKCKYAPNIDPHFKFGPSS